MQEALVGLLRVVPLPFVYGLMAPVIPFYMLFDRRGYRASLSFFRDRIGMSGLKAFLYVYANEFRMGQMVMDRFAAYAGKKFEVKVHGQDVFDRLSGSDGGFIQLSAHTGNYELAGYMLKSRNKTINSLVFGGEKETVMRNRRGAFERNNVVMIPVSDDLSHLFALNAALDNGDIVSMPGDRVFGSSKTVPCRFFGAEAGFPQGPFALAAKKKVPVVNCFVMKESTRVYSLYIDELPSGDAASCARGYASKLESTVRKYPAQWFNFYDFWSHEL